MSLIARDILNERNERLKKQLFERSFPTRVKSEVVIQNQKLVDIIVPHHNRHDMLARFLDGIDLSLFNIIICCGRSFGTNCNKGAKIAETDKFIFCNDDINISNEQLIKISNCLDEYDYVGSTQLAGSVNKKKYWGIGLFTGTDGNVRHQICLDKKPSKLPAGFCFGVTRKFWESVGGFDEGFKTGNEDVDLGLKAIESDAKMTILDLEIPHEESQSEGRFNNVNINEELFYKKWSQEKLRKFQKLNPLIF